MSRSLITRAIRQCVIDWPRLATSLLRLDPREKPGIGTIAVDNHLRLYFDSEWIQEQTFDDLVFFIKQEVIHPLLGHAGRSQRILGNLTGAARKYVQEQLNIAGDCAVHGFMSQERQYISSQAVKPQDCLSVKTESPLPSGLSLEEYFMHLFDREHMEQLQELETTSGGNERVQDGKSPGNGKGPTTSGYEGGSGADGEKRDYEDEFEPPKLGDGNRQDSSSGTSDGDLDELSDDFLEGSSSRGDGSGQGRLRKLGKVKPKLTPEQLIRMAVNASSKELRGFDQPTYRRQSRRQHDSEFIRPSYRQHKPAITVVVDTSGSMGQRDLNLAAGVLEVALKGLDLDSLRVVMADHEVQTNCEVSDLKSIKFVGGGGTNMDYVCDKIAEDHSKDTDLLICVTDGETHWPESRKVPMVAAITRKPKWGQEVPSHMKKVDLY